MATNADQITSISQLALDPNVLDAYESYTYNFTLRIYEKALAEQNILPTPGLKSIIIAESGVTAAFNIKRVEILSIPGTTRENKGATATLVKIDLEEPLGFTFIDRLIQAGVSLGLPTLSPAPYTLELDLVGWDDTGMSIKPILPTKTWVLNLRNVIPELRKGGSFYTLEFVPQSEQVQQDIRSQITKPLKFTKASTLTQTLNNFAAAMTAASDIASEGTNYTVSGSKNDTTRLINTYKFVIQNGDTQLSQISNWTMMNNLNQGSQRQFEVTPSEGNPTQFDIVIHPGKDVFEVLTALLANTNEGYKFLAPTADPIQVDFNTNDPTNFFHFDTFTTNGTFDAKTGSYSQTHTIQIIPKVIPRNNILTTTPGSASDVQNLVTNNLLIKGYEYLFTGKNTSVLELNLNFSTMWVDSMPLFMSLLKDGQLSSNLAPNTMPIDNLLPYVPSVNKSAVRQSTNQPTGNFAFAATKPDSTVNQTYLEQFSSNAITIEKFARQEPDRDYTQTEKYTKGYSTPGDPQSLAKLSIFGYLADNSFINAKPMGAPGVSSMLSINLMIRGDPFWLGISNEEVTSNYSGATYTSIRKTQRRYAAYQSGEQQFYLKFKPPQGIDDNTGLMQFNTTSVFNNLYSVMQVVSTFENGIFKQEITANLNRSYQAGAVQTTVNPLLDQANTNTNTNSVVYTGSGTSNITNFLNP